MAELALPLLSAALGFSLTGYEANKYWQYRQCLKTGTHENLSLVESTLTTADSLPVRYQWAPLTELAPLIRITTPIAHDSETQYPIQQELHLERGVEKTGVRMVPIKTGKQTTYVPQTYTYTEWNDLHTEKRQVRSFTFDRHRFTFSGPETEGMEILIPKKTEEYDNPRARHLLDQLGLVSYTNLVPQKMQYDTLRLSLQTLETHTSYTGLLEYQLNRPRLLALGTKSAVTKIFRSRVGFSPALMMTGLVLTAVPIPFFMV